MAKHDKFRKTTDAEAMAWIRRKLQLPANTPMFEGGGKTIAGELHVVCSGHHGMETYIKAFRCGAVSRWRVADFEAGPPRRGTPMSATLILTCDAMQTKQHAQFSQQRACGFSESFAGLPLDKVLALVADAGWRRCGDEWMCPKCSMNATDDLGE